MKEMPHVIQVLEFQRFVEPVLMVEGSDLSRSSSISEQSFGFATRKKMLENKCNDRNTHKNYQRLTNSANQKCRQNPAPFVTVPSIDNFPCSLMLAINGAMSKVG